MFEKFRKKKDELGPDSTKKEEEGGTAETTQYQPQKIEPEKASNVIEQPNPRPSEQVKIPEPMQQRTMSTGEDIGIGALMDKRNKLEETIDYVGLMIKNLKDKRTNLEKSIEDESVDIKNLKEKLVKVGQYIEEEKLGIKTLQQKRSNVEREADDVAAIINNLREKLLSIDRVVNEEGNKIEKFKDARPKSESSFS
jgi:chromosome segregation ATPase